MFLVRAAAPTQGFLTCPTSISQKKVSNQSKGTFASAESDENDCMAEEEIEKFDQIVEKFLSVDVENDTDFPSAFPKNPFGTSLGENGGKAGLYSNEELFQVFTLHQELSVEFFESENDETKSDEKDKAMSQNPMAGIHDLVTSALESQSGGNDASILPSFAKEPLGFSAQEFAEIEIDEALKLKKTQICAIASDVDGTILTSQMTIHPKTRLSIKQAIKSSSSSVSRLQYFFPATGKSRKGALDSLGIEIGNLIEQNCAGVYLQGLYCIDEDGNVVFEKKLDKFAINAAEQLVEDHGISIVAYDGDDLYTTDQTEIIIHLHEHYGEPLPLLLPQDDGEDVRKLATHEPSMHKLLLMDDDTEKLTNIVRPKLEALAEQYGACVTQALPTMLELLPQGCSKAKGVEKLCEAIGIEPSRELLALGDAENDAGMLELACVGVAVGNASPPARKASDLVLPYTNDEGGAGFAIELFALDEV